jgi:glycosyltransferase involved in cell wall biosynthesis
VVPLRLLRAFAGETTRSSLRAYCGRNIWVFFAPLRLCGRHPSTSNLLPNNLNAQNNQCRKVYFVESAAAMGGVQFSTLYLVQHLDRARWEPVVICPEEGDLTEACRRSGVAVHILDFPALHSTSFRVGRSSVRLPNPLAWIWDVGAISVAAQRLARFFKQTNPDLVVTKGLFSHFYGGLAARRSGIPCVWHVQDFISERFWKIYQRLFAHAARWLPDHIIADGASIGRQLHRSMQDRISIIHNGVDTDVFRPDIDGQRIRREVGIPDDAMVVGHVGRMTPWKGQHYLLGAFARVAAVMKNVYLLFVGAPVFDSNAYQRDLLHLTAKLGLNDRVKFAGYRHDIPFVLAAMDVFAFTSVEKDTSPLTLLSALSSGRPVVAFDIEGVQELLPPHEQVLVPVGQVNVLAHSIINLLSDAALRQRLAVSARRLAETEFGIDKYVARVESAFLKAAHV